eukprot:XP_017453300.1 PREDICTED: uncharacterized protein LOC103693456 isoform X1 [Rattus norvegicus]
MESFLPLLEVAETLPCACALALGCLAVLLVPPNGALEDEVHLQPIPEPRVASWFSGFGQINKYLEKLFGNSLKKAKNHKKPSNTTKSTPSNTTVRPPLNVTNPMQKNISKSPTQELHGRPSLVSSPSSSMNNKQQ